MNDGWKRYERWVARIFSSTRIPRLGRMEADVVSTHRLWIDAKYRKEVPNRPFELMDACELLGFNLLALQDGTTIMRAETLAGIATGNTEMCGLVAGVGAVGATVTAWLNHIALSAPEDAMPVIVMQRPGKKFKHTDSLAVVNTTDFVLWRTNA